MKLGNRQVDWSPTVSCSVLPVGRSLDMCNLAVDTASAPDAAGYSGGFRVSPSGLRDGTHNRGQSKCQTQKSITLQFEVA
jgi:hypothetical protein